jgi:hypothetical protein
MKATFILAITALFSISAINASAQNHRNLQGERQRIHQGVKTGELTRGEAARLKSQKADLRNEAIQYKANDGRIGPRERADLRRDNRRLDRNIYHQKHDLQKRRF